MICLKKSCSRLPMPNTYRPKPFWVQFYLIAVVIGHLEYKQVFVGDKYNFAAISNCNIEEVIK